MTGKLETLTISTDLKKLEYCIHRSLMCEELQEKLRKRNNILCQRQYENVTEKMTSQSEKKRLFQIYEAAF